MEKAGTTNVTIEEALKILEEAAKQKKDELKDVMADKYTHLKDVFLETETSLLKSLADAKRHATEAAARAKEVGVEKTKELADEVDKKVHSHPWPVIGGAAVVSLLLGYILARNHK